MSLLIDKLTGQIYLFDIPTSTGGTGTGGTSSYPQVNFFVALPPASAHNNQIYVVLQSTGAYTANRKEAGLYYSNGTTWSRLGDIPSYFSSNNFHVFDSVDPTKNIQFKLSGNTTNTTRTITMRNSDGTIAYLSDINGKLDKSVFTGYTASTQVLINTKLDKIVFNGYTGSTQTLINTKLDKTAFNVYSAQTQTQINSKLNTSAFNIYSGLTEIHINTKLDKSIFNTYTATTETRLENIESTLAGLTGGTPSTTHAIQVIDLVGGINVNSVVPTAIMWTNVEFSGTSLAYTGASRIYIQTTGQYEISYNLVLRNTDNTSKSIGSVIRVNGSDEVTPLSVASYIDNGSSITGSNNLANYKKTLNAGDFLELTAFRISNGGTVNTIPGASWIRVIKT